jgi:hypothetical protein
MQIIKLIVVWTWAYIYEGEPCVRLHLFIIVVLCKVTTKYTYFGYDMTYISRIVDIILCNTRATRKVTSGDLLTKQAMRKNIIYKKYVHT